MQPLWCIVKLHKIYVTYLVLTEEFQITER